MLQDVPFDLVIGHPTLKRLGRVLDLRSEEALFDYCGQQASFPIHLVYEQSPVPKGDTDSEDFTSDSDSLELSDDEELGKKDGELFLTSRYYEFVVSNKISR